MRRVMLIAGMLLVLVALAACGGSEEPASPDTVQDAPVTNTPVEEPAQAPTQAPTVTEQPTEEPTLVAAETETGAAEGAHIDGDEHSEEEHAEGEAHTEGDEHSEEEHAEGEAHTEGDEHSEEEHAEGEAHTEGDEHSEEEHAEGEAHTEGDEHSEEEHAEGEAHADDEAVAEGLALFRGLGCAGCHGQDGEGGAGPALAGHTAQQVQRQVRTPQGGVMPAYGEEQLTADQLQLIIAWVMSLGPATGEHMHGHGEEAGGETDSASAVAAHLRLAFFAVTDGNLHDAEHHLEDLLASLEDEHAQAEVEEILDSLSADADLHDLEHELEHLMEGLNAGLDGVTGPNLHLQLVLDSLTLDDLDAADHHLVHYAELVEDADLAAEAQELRDHLADGDLHEVEEGVQALLTGEESDHHG